MVASITEDGKEVYIQQLENTLEVFEERLAEIEFAREDFGWVRLGGETSYEFSLDYLRSVVARSRLYFLQNPLIHRAVTLQSDYVFAQGVNTQATSDVVNDVIQAFLDDVQNKREFTSHQARLEKEQTLLLDGNIFFVLFTDKSDRGTVKIRSVIVDEITNIITNPEDANEVWFYKREYLNRDTQKHHVVYYPDINYMPLVDKLPPTRDDGPIFWDAPILHIKTGALAKSRYGIPETYSALDWAQAHTKMLGDWATIIRMFARYAFTLTTPGNKSSVAAAKTKLQSTISTSNAVETNPPVTAGSIFIRQKDGATMEPMKTSGLTTSAKDARELRIMIAAAMGLPDPMLSGEVDVGNLATAKTLDRPTELKFRSRQQLWTEVHKQILEWVIRWAIEAPNGLLRKYVKTTLDRGQIVRVPKRDPKTKKPIDLHIEVTFPPILEHTITDRIDAVIGAMTLNGKTFAVNSPEFEKLTVRLMLQALGLDDVDELIDHIFNSLVAGEPDANKTTGQGDGTTQSDNKNQDNSVRSGSV